MPSRAPPNMPPKPPSRFKDWATIVCVILAIIIVGSLKWVATSETSSPTSPSPAPTQTAVLFDVIQTVIVTPTDSPRPIPTIRLTAMPYLSPFPTWTATPPWMDNPHEMKTQ
jgi:hypothetical protein